MRTVAVALLAVLLAAPAVASDLTRVYVDWVSGHDIAPTTPFATPPTAHVFAFDVVECYPDLRLDLLYEPSGTTVPVGNGGVSIGNEFRAEVWHAGARVLAMRVQQSTHNTVLGAVDELGPHELRLSLGFGANVAWEMRLRALFDQGNPACNPPLD